MKCPNPRCRAEMNPEARFCLSCGADLSRAEDKVRPVQARPPFVLSIAKPEAMQVGRRSNLEVCFRAVDDIYESVEFVLRCGTDVIGRAGCCEGRPGDTDHHVTLQVQPRACGEARLALDVVCQIGQGGDVETHTAEIVVPVDEQRPTSFAPVFNFNQSLTADRAGDAKGGDINLNLGGLQLPHQADTTRYNTSASFASIETSLAKSPARLTLKCGDDIVQLLSDDRVSFGRSRDTAIPIRVCGPDGNVSRELNEYNISRHHFSIERSGTNDCIVCDGMDEAPSAYGTRVDGKSVASRGSVRLDAGREVLLEAGREDVALKMRIAFHRDSWGRAAGFVLDRLDGARQRICAVWREVPLDGGDRRVLWNGSRWSLSVDGRPPVPLVVGTTISIGGKPFDVLPFRKTHLR